MSKLLERLSDPARSGVYRTRQENDIVDALRGSRLALTRIAFPGKGIFDAFATALEFPDWFGRNWDALEDCLGDLSWRKAEGHVLLISGFEAVARDELGVLREVLASSAEFWAGRGRSFFVVFIDPRGALTLPALYKEKAGDG
jgi:hypothetical protein